MIGLTILVVSVAVLVGLLVLSLRSEPRGIDEELDLACVAAVAVILAVFAVLYLMVVS